MPEAGRERPREAVALRLEEEEGGEGTKGGREGALERYYRTPQD